MNEKKAYIYALSAVFLWSTVATAFKYTLYYFSPSQLLLVSSFSSFLILLFIVLYNNDVHYIKNMPKDI